jgi:hypothetical protein
MALRGAADRWSTAEMKRLLKEFFDPAEFAILCHRLQVQVGTPQMKEQLGPARRELMQKTNEALNSDPIREWMKLIPLYVAQWD